MLKNLLYKIDHHAQNICHRISPKWSSILYLVRSRDISLREAVELWHEAENHPEKNSSFLGKTPTTTETFFYLNAKREDELSEFYLCVYGTCTVIWFRGRNRGGWGRTGCPCDSLADPRGELIKKAGEEV